FVSLEVSSGSSLLLHTVVCRFHIYLLWRKPCFPPLLVELSLSGMAFATLMFESKLVGLCCSLRLIYLSSMAQSLPLPQYEDFRLSFSHHLPQYKVLKHLISLILPLCEAHLP